MFFMHWTQVPCKVEPTPNVYNSLSLSLSLSLSPKVSLEL